MKYLNLNQSILNKTDKYSYKKVSFLNEKIEFNKYWGVFDDVTEESIEKHYRKLFRAYMNNNIYISWNE
jgi:hypothetical protein